MEFWALTFDFVGKILVSYTALMVHHRVFKEHKIDKKVFAEMRHEQRLGVLGIICIMIGYFLHLNARVFF